MHLRDYDYQLPPELIANYPLPERSASRLLYLNNGKILHKKFSDIVDLIEPRDLLVFNNTKVIPARLFGVKETGGQVEVLVERILTNKRVLALLRASKPARANTKIRIADKYELLVIAKHDDLYELELRHDVDVLEMIEAIGKIPLPPYFQRQAEESDKERYQTVYAKHKGSVAAPTAGLHFDEKIMLALLQKRVTMANLVLHVGAGTFLPVRVDDIHQHRMHKEYLQVSAELCAQVQKTKAQGGRVIAVGTTTARSLETASVSGEIKPFDGMTDIFIYPGFQFHCVDVLITNFHAPATTLLMLVSAFAGYQNIMSAYQQAIAEKYRFLSYGDSTFLTKQG